MKHCIFNTVLLFALLVLNPLALNPVAVAQTPVDQAPVNPAPATISVPAVPAIPAPAVQAEAQPAAAPPVVTILPPTMGQKISAFFSNIFNAILHEEPEPDPTAAGIAPFTNPDDVKPLTQQEMIKGALSTDNTPLDQPHRSSRDLEEWLQQAMAEALSFDSLNYDTYRTQLLPRGMSASGVDEFNNWVVSNGILDALAANGLQLNAFSMERPFLLNEGVVSGRYRWLYETPVMISFVPRGTKVYDPKLAVDSRRLIITVQIGRVEQSLLEHNVMIETWAVKAAPAAK